MSGETVDVEVLGCKQSDYPNIDVRLFDFRNFLYLAFKYLRLPSPTHRQMEMAYWLQFGPKRLQAQAFRGLGKSILAEIFCCWALFIMYSNPDVARPEFAVLSVSAAGSRAHSFSTFVYNLIMGWEMLEDLRPDKDGRSSRIAFDVGLAPVQDSPSMRALGITGQMAGARGNLMVLDDVEVPTNSATQLRRESLSEAVKEVDALLKPPPSEEEFKNTYPHLPRWLVLQLVGRIIVLGTPQTEETIYQQLENRGYIRRVWPSRFPSTKWMENHGYALAPKIAEELEEHPGWTTGYGIDMKAGKPTDTRFGDMDLCEREASYGRSGFALQFMLDTTLSDADRYPLKINDIIVSDNDPEQAPQKLSWGSSPDLICKELECVGFRADRYHRPFMVSKEWARYTGSVMAVDPAGRGKDETTYSVVNFLNSHLFLMDNKGFGASKGYEDDVLMGIALAAKKWGVKRIIVEKNFGDGMFLKLLTPFIRKVYPVTLEEITQSVQKERRIIETLEPVLNQHKLIVGAEVIRADKATGDGLSDEAQLRYQLFYQLSRVTYEKGCLMHDDRLDSLAMAVGYWVDQMALDADSEIQRRGSIEIDKEIAAFMEDNLGKPRSSKTFLSLGGRGR